MTNHNSKLCHAHQIVIAHLPVEKETIKETINTLVKTHKTDIIPVKLEKKFIEMITMKTNQEKDPEGHKMMTTGPKENNLMNNVPV